MKQQLKLVKSKTRAESNTSCCCYDETAGKAGKMSLTLMRVNCYHWDLLHSQCTQIITRVNVAVLS